MTRLIKNELNRIYTCKINRISVLLLIMISVVYGFFDSVSGSDYNLL